MTKQATTEVQKTPSKMDRARVLYTEVFSKGYDLDGKTQRQVFIQRAQDEIELTKAGANTYYQNLSNEARGKPLYKYNKYEAKAKVEKADVAKAEKQATATSVDLTQRYQIMNKKKVTVNSFASKKAAENYVAAGVGLTMIDSKAS